MTYVFANIHQNKSFLNVKLDERNSIKIKHDMVIIYLKLLYLEEDFNLDKIFLTKCICLSR